jgi:hypothetical protein
MQSCKPFNQGVYCMAWHHLPHMLHTFRLPLWHCPSHTSLTALIIIVMSWQPNLCLCCVFFSFSRGWMLCKSLHVVVHKVLLYHCNVITTIVHGIMAWDQAGILVVDHVVVLYPLSEIMEDQVQQSHGSLVKMTSPWKFQQGNGLYFQLKYLIPFELFYLFLLVMVLSLKIVHHLFYYAWCGWLIVTITKYVCAYSILLIILIIISIEMLCGPDGELPEKLRNLESRLIEHVSNEIMDRDPNVRWNDIGL